jgi:hypothetical protein
MDWSGCEKDSESRRRIEASSISEGTGEGELPRGNHFSRFWAAQLPSLPGPRVLLKQRTVACMS